MAYFFHFSSTSSIIGEKLNEESYFFFLKHFLLCLYCINNYLYYFGTKKKNNQNLFAVFFFLISLLLLFLVPFIGIEVRGSQRWINLFFLPRFQPVEVVKPFFVLISAQIISSQLNYNLYRKYFYTLILLSIVLFLLIIQPDLGPITF